MLSRRYGHIYKLAQKVKEGIDSVEGVEGVLFQACYNSLPSLRVCAREGRGCFVGVISVHTELSECTN